MSLPDEIKKTKLTCAITRIPFIPPHPAALPPGEPEKYSENGRLYHSFRKGKYMLPCDEVRNSALLVLLLVMGLPAKGKACRPKWIAWTSFTNSSPLPGKTDFILSHLLGLMSEDPES